VRVVFDVSPLSHRRTGVGNYVLGSLAGLVEAAGGEHEIVGVIDGIDMQLTGEVRRIDVDAITQRLDDGDIVLISPLGYSPTGEIFNLSVEEVATQVAVRLAAARVAILQDDETALRGLDLVLARA